MIAALAISSAGAPQQNLKKLSQAAQQFEALLLNNLLRPLEQSFSALPGTGQDSGSDSFSSLGTEALSTALSHQGGVGIAQLIVRKMLEQKGLSGSIKGADTTKVLPFLSR